MLTAFFTLLLCTVALLQHAALAQAVLAPYNASWNPSELRILLHQDLPGNITQPSPFESLTDRGFWELVAGARLAIEDFNSATYPLLRSSASASSMSSLYSLSNVSLLIQSSHVFGDLAALDPTGPTTEACLQYMDPRAYPGAAGPHVEMSLGYVGLPSLQAAAHLGRVFNVPVVTDLVGELPMDTLVFPTARKTTFSLSEEVHALVLMFRKFGWDRVVVVVASDDDSFGELGLATVARLRQAGIQVPKVIEFAPTQLFENAALPVEAQVKGVGEEATPLPRYETTPRLFNRVVSTLRSELGPIEENIVLLVAFSTAAVPVLRAAKEAGVTGHPRVWVGTRYWTWDLEIHRDLGDTGVLDGVVGTSFPIFGTPETVSAYNESWARQRERDISLLYDIDQPRVSRFRYDTTLLTATAVSKLDEVRDLCSPGTSLWEAAHNSFLPSGPETPPPPESVGAQAACRLTLEPLAPAGLERPFGAAPLDVADKCCLRAALFFLPLPPPGSQPPERRTHPDGTVLLRLLDEEAISGAGNLSLSSSLRVEYVNLHSGYGHPIGYFVANSSHSVDTSDTSASYDIVASEFVLAEDSIVWPDGFGGRAPSVASPKGRIERPTTSAVVVIVFFACVSLVVTCSLTVFNVALRNEPLIRASSPVINSVTLVGAMLLQVFVIVYSLHQRITSDDSYATLCMIELWLMMVGASLLFGSLFWKTYRVHLIFNNKVLSRAVGLHDRSLLLHTAALVAIDALILLVWNIGWPLRREFRQRKWFDEDGDLQVRRREVCTGERLQLFSLMLTLYKAALLIFGVWLAYRVRKVTIPALNDSKYIGYSLFLTLVATLIGGGAYVASPEGANFRLLVICMCFTLLTLSIVCIIFVPKLWAVYKGTAKDLMRDKSREATLDDDVEQLDREYQEATRRHRLEVEGLHAEIDTLVRRIRVLEQRLVDNNIVVPPRASQKRGSLAIPASKTSLRTSGEVTESDGDEDRDDDLELRSRASLGLASVAASSALTMNTLGAQDAEVEMGRVSSGSDPEVGSVGGTLDLAHLQAYVRQPSADPDAAADHDNHV